MKKEGDLPVACVKWYDFTKWLLERVETAFNADIMDVVANESGISIDSARRAAEVLLRELHKRFVDYEGLNVKGISEQVRHELTETGYAHLVGLIEGTIALPNSD
jgi:hypothetical protein